MKEVGFWEISVRRGVYLLVGLVLTLAAVLPFDLSAGGVPGPDVLFCITIIYVIRRPEFVPIWVVFTAFFLRDILTTAPLGLWTLLVLAGTEVVRSNIQAFREYHFLLEWTWIGTIYGLMLVVQNAVLSLSLSIIPGLMEQFYQFIFTAALYPVLVAFLRFGFGITRPSPGEYDALGHRL